ncbi:gamma-aminobutyric acid receptor subunit beta isoform X1 [Lucilia sericata]|uniref:gamma-aminobutyric acid receptor subunit beta isoform X1 n=1 Tax=Lucilia sericata TaxID=13632 RepID=UPI0018A8225C|nr:gamma-aminobutyric acid receptor subunit beta isoform X1 [Lucilia sericata]XP_037812034.1 gamma-aminobutyric acid receptor subunit beta isoform X1 [Lucilia sericata]XP_037812035.1 gamma-aminobutyric acid receptor subunit beta isoform X1 [Lucilia sericata]XP_037812036.1 gamma-aminobutyric acid receptor subunit beta isoform X1 [Lucilia sericata]XP_037812037.1 gamma-aminobutyric acid receptor subunit beta isoform X1 [Lucilia sericata]XP_037812038.1 gamma-aminobutyric acid receptor subunit beta
MSDSMLYRKFDTFMPRSRIITLWLAFNLAMFLQEPKKQITTVNAATAGGSMLGDVNISAILDSFSVSYDKRVRPNYGGPPVEVGVTMYVLSISSLSEVKMDFTLDFYFRQFWTDPRLAYRKRPGVETLSVGSEFIKNIWVPDTFFVNEKQSYFHIATTSNEFIRVHHSGSITRSIRLTITASCPMNLQYFPMDRQLCHIEIESFGYTMRDIRYKWNEGPNSVGVSNEVSLPQFKVLGHRQRAMEISLTTGNYSRLACEIQFVRSMGYYLIQIYIPSGLIVIISWVSFWLNRNATPARVALGVTTVLTMTTLMSSTNAALPKISYVKSIDVYLGTCFVMVFASLLEYATVGYMAKRIQMRKQRFMTIQKMAEQKKQQQLDGVQQPPNPNPNTGVDHGGHGHGHGHHSHGHPHVPKQTVSNRPIGFQNIQQNVGARGCSIVGPLFQEVRFKVHDPKAHSKGGTLENTVNGGRGGPPVGPHGPGPQGGGGGGGPPGGGGGGGGGGAPPEGGDAEAAVPAHLLHPGKVKKVILCLHFLTPLTIETNVNFSLFLYIYLYVTISIPNSQKKKNIPTHAIHLFVNVYYLFSYKKNLGHK